ncbi:MAG: electron transfer flavoprotein subunit alpha/FixB family protein [Acidobacteriota bacterium]
MAGVLVFAEQREGNLRTPVLEAVSQGRRMADALACDLAVLLIGDDPSGLEERLEPLGADAIITVQDDRLRLYVPEAFTRATEEAIRRRESDVVLMTASAMGRDLAARVAARFETGLISDCTGLETEDGALIARRPVYSGNAIATMEFSDARPMMVTLRANMFGVLEEPRQAKTEMISLEVPFQEKDFRSKTIRVESGAGGALDVSEAEIVVSGGRAMKGPENFKYIRMLADALGGAVGASRAAVDAGWIDHQYQVGQTGKVVSPTLYVACGISGAIQHLAGMSSSKVIVAINKDPDAPIFKIADYGIVGDLYEAIPLMVEEIKKLKA